MDVGRWIQHTQVPFSEKRNSPSQAGGNRGILAVGNFHQEEGPCKISLHWWAYPGCKLGLVQNKIEVALGDSLT